MHKKLKVNRYRGSYLDAAAMWRIRSLESPLKLGLFGASMAVATPPACSTAVAACGECPPVASLCCLSSTWGFGSPEKNWKASCWTRSCELRYNDLFSQLVTCRTTVFSFALRGLSRAGRAARARRNCNHLLCPIRLQGPLHSTPDSKCHTTHKTYLFRDQTALPQQYFELLERLTQRSASPPIATFCLVFGVPQGEKAPFTTVVVVCKQKIEKSTRHLAVVDNIFCFSIFKLFE